MTAKTAKATSTPAVAPKSNGQSLNTVALVGRLTANPVLRTTSPGPSGKSVASFRIAVAQRGDRVSFQTVTVWGKLAEICAAHLVKGRLVSIAGRLDSREWLTQDGTRRNAVTVTAFNVQFLDRKPADTSTEVGA
jgi:single-strand DNA-binding protein